MFGPITASARDTSSVAFGGSVARTSGHPVGRGCGVSVGGCTSVADQCTHGLAGVPGAGMTATMKAECPHHIERPVMRQEWRDLLFVSGRVDADVLRNLLPAGVEIDEFDGSGWISYVPFTMRDIAFAPLPPVPYLGTFPEVNIRTYVRHQGVPYVWFFSLDIPRVLPVAVAKTAFALPYRWAKVDHTVDDRSVTTTTRRRFGDAHAATAATLGGDVVPDELDVFLTARWGLPRPLGLPVSTDRRRVDDKRLIFQVRHGFTSHRPPVLPLFSFLVI